MDINQLVESFSPQEENRTDKITRRIEQAKLYEVLLNHEIFSPGSARPEIQDIVTQEIREFILSRLENLMGITLSSGKITNSVFSEEQIIALQAVAERLLSKTQGTQALSAPQINQLNRPSLEAPQLTPAKTKIPAEVQPAPTDKKSDAVSMMEQQRAYKERQTGNAGSTIRPKPMPSRAEIDQIHARQVGNIGSGNTDMSKILELAIRSSQEKNKDVSEED